MLKKYRMNKSIGKAGTLADSVIKSYAQIFFSDNYWFAGLLMVVSFFDYKAGICGFLAAAFSNGIGIYWGFSKFNIKKGYYGFNSLLVGLGLGHSFEFTLVLVVLIILASILSLLLTVGLEGILSKYRLPYLALPFVLTIWVAILSTRQFTVLHLSQRDIYQANEIYAIGGKWLLDLFERADQIPIIYSFKVYFLSLGAIIFQYNIIAGILVATGLLIHSRISFMLSLIGFYTAYLFYKLAGISVGEMNNTYIGFNFILTSIALGGYFIIPSRRSFLWLILMLPIVVLISLASNSVLMIYQLPMYSFPFSLSVLIFLYALKLRVTPSLKFAEVLYQKNSPEKNLYLFENSNQRYKDFNYFPIALPFWGEWCVTQGHSGEITHQGDWKDAIDFEIKDASGKTYKHDGEELADYYCYNKAVVAPGDGVVVEIVDEVENNKVGDINTNQNWGNVIIIKHVDFLYSKIAHLKAGSFKVKEGDRVKKGDMLANAGNSGRSPFPHVHFQLQATPFIGSKTMSYPISQYILKTANHSALKLFDVPLKDDCVQNMEVSPLLKKALHFIPGQKLNFRIVDGEDIELVEWEVNADIYNNLYIYSSKTNSYAYLFNSGTFLMFKEYIGDKKDHLFLFYLALYKIPLTVFRDLSVSDALPVNIYPVKQFMFIQDFVSPFFMFMKANYHLSCLEATRDFSAEEIVLASSVENSVFGKSYNSINFEMHFEKNAIGKISCRLKDKVVVMELQKG
jgi:urea transporter/murein DD-endopeptidase MepM/ murein hydrolase activator NlpD